MSRRPKYSEEFKIEAVKQVKEHGRSVADVSSRLGVSAWSLYQWIKGYDVPQKERESDNLYKAEIKRLQAEVKRLLEERDILKKAAAYFAKECG